MWPLSHVVGSLVHDRGRDVGCKTVANMIKQLFDTEFGVFMHTATGREAIRALEYSIPADLAAHINFVHPTVS